MTRRGYSALVITVVVWLVIELIAAIQRDYFKGANQTCARTSTILVAAITGPLNYVGANPRISCHILQPSK
jgi:hypothetical protein